MSHLSLSLAGGEISLSVRSFAVFEVVSALFEVSITGVSRDPDLDLDAMIAQPARFLVAADRGGSRTWTGICSHIEFIDTDADGVSTYEARIVPALWLATQRTNHRIFQDKSTPEIANVLFAEWGIEAVWQLDPEAYPAHEHRVQYGETDYAFLCRLLGEAGIAFTFGHDEEQGSHLVLSDALHLSEARAGGPIRYIDSPTTATEGEHVSKIRITRDTQTDHVTLGHIDLLQPLRAAGGLEARKHRVLALAEGGEVEAAAREAREREADRALACTVTLRTNALDVWPGVVFTVAGHGRPDLMRPLLVTGASLEGTADGELTIEATATFADAPYRAPLVTSKPEINSIQTATVVAIDGNERHTDTLGCVRVRFPWDRDGQRNPRGSCRVRVGREWAGAGSDAVTLPCVGQEILVGFLDGNPDLPVVVGHVQDTTAPVGDNKAAQRMARNKWKSDGLRSLDDFGVFMFDTAPERESASTLAPHDLAKLVDLLESDHYGAASQFGVNRGRSGVFAAVDSIAVGQQHSFMAASSAVGLDAGGHNCFAIASRSQKRRERTVASRRTERAPKRHR